LVLQQPLSRRLQLLAAHLEIPINSNNLNNNLNNLRYLAIPQTPTYLDSRNPRISSNKPNPPHVSVSLSTGFIPKFI
jgi:hypothetical protein